MRIMLKLVLAALVIWTVYSFGQAFWIQNLAEHDQARLIDAFPVILQASGMTRAQFLAMFAQPGERSTFLLNFEGSMWHERLLTWGIVAGLLLLVAILLAILAGKAAPRAEKGQVELTM